MKKVFRSLSLLTLAGVTLASVSGCSVFGETYRYEYDSETGGYAVTGLKNYTDNNLEIPSKHKGKKVTKIADGAFEGWYTIKSFDLPNTLVAIGENAFKNCDSVKKFDLPEKKLISIGDGAFAECDALVDINIPSTLRYLGDDVFLNSDKIETEESADGNSIYLDGVVLMSLTESGKNETSFTVSENTKFINSGVFKDNENIKSVQLYATDANNGVYSIGASAFEGATNLESVKLSNNLLQVGSRSFYGYDFGTATDLSFGDGTDDEVIIKTEAFENAKNISSITFENDAEIESFAFSGTDTITNVEFKKNAQINDSAFAANGTVAGVSEKLETLKVAGTAEIGASAFENSTLVNLDLASPVSIGEGAFKNNKNLIGSASGLTIGKTIEKFGASAFEGCSALTDVTIEDGAVATTLGDALFKNATSLQNVSLSNTTETINYQSFNGCENLKNINVPTSLKIIGSESFVGTALTSIDFTEAEGLESIYAKAFMNCENLTSVKFNENITNVGAYAFQNADLVSVELPEACITVGVSAFAGNENLTTVKFSDAMFTLADSTFAGDTKLTSVSFGNYVNETAPATTRVNSGAFENCASLKSFKINDEVLAVGSSVFAGCTSLESAVLPESLTEIPANTFKNCTSLSKFTINANVTSIGASAFEGCTSIKSIDIPDNVTSIGEAAFKDTGLTSIVLGDNVTSIGAYAYQNCTDVTSVDNIEIPETIETIGAGAFDNLGIGEVDYIGNENNRNLILIKYSGKETTVTVNPNTAIIYEEALKGNKTIEQLVITPKVKMLAKSAFEGCTNLTSITIEEGDLLEIGEAAFKGCTKIEILDLSSSKIEYIGASAFEGCTSLKTVILPNTVKTIDSRAFYGCKALESVTTGSNLKTIGGSAFANCSSLTSIDIKSVIFLGVASFRNCSSLQTVEFGDVIYEVGKQAFEGCKALTKVELDKDALVSIGENAFHNCAAAEEIVLGQYLQTIGASAFKGCASLKEIVIPNLVSTIGKNAFEDCEALTTAVIGSNVYDVQVEVFANCTSLKTVEIKFSTVEKTKTNYTYDQYYEAATTILNDIVIDSNISLDDATVIYNAYNAVLDTAVKEELKLADIKPIEVVENAYAELEQSGFIINQILGSNNNYARTIGETDIFLSDVFDGCEAIDTVIVSGVDSVTTAANMLMLSYNTANSNPLYNGAKLYTRGEDGTTLTEVTSIEMSNEVFTKVGSYALTGWTGEKVVLNNNIASLGANAFANCNAEEIDLGSNIALLEKNAFSGSGVKRLVTGQQLITVNSGVFAGCNLDYIVFKSKLQSIYGAFDKSGDYAKGTIKTIYYEDSEAKWQKVQGYNQFGTSTTIVYNSTGPAEE